MGTGARALAVCIALAAVLAVPASASAATIPGQYIVVLKHGVSEPATAADHAKKGAQVFQQYRHALNGYAAKLSDSALAAVRADKRVRFVAPDEEVNATGCYLGNGLTIQIPQVLPCGVDRIDGDVSSTRSGDGKRSVNVNVAVVDSGIDVDHPDLNVVGGTNCTSSGGGKSFDDPNGHGTHVAGTIGAKDNNLGVVGVAPGASLWAVRVLDKNLHGSTSQVICGVDFVTATRTDSDPTNDIRVANMSLGGGGPADDGNCGLSKKDAFHLAICNSVRAGVAYAVAAGNDSVDIATDLPGEYDEVLTATAITDLDGKPGGVGTVDALTQAGSPCASDLSQEGPVVDDTPIFFSNFATLPADQAHTVAAPGVCVPSAWNCTDTCYARDSGTSMASPHVAGTVALCIASGPCAGLTPAQIRTKLVADAQAYNQANSGYGFTGDPLHSPDPNKYYGYLIRAGLY